MRPTVLLLEERSLLSTFTVNSTADDGSAGTLRYEIGLANSNAGANTIAFDSTIFSTPQTLTLAGSQLELSNRSGTETITGPAAGVTVSGARLSRVFQVDGGVTASISGLTITCGQAGNYSRGGGVYNFGTATLTNCTISGNSSGNSGSGGGLFNAGTATLTNCTISGNSAGAPANGGGLANVGGTTTLTNCTVSGNFGSYCGGLYNYGGTATLTNTIVAGQASGGNTFGGYSGSNNLVGGNPLLAPLGNYGGPTQTMPLLPGSPAIGMGTAVSGVTTDQRGERLDSPPDIGAFQSQGFALTRVAGSTPQTSQIGTPFANPLAVTVKANNPIEPVDGGVVSFANTTTQGALAILSAPSAVVGGGQAATSAEPDNAVGSYTVVASATGTSPVSFDLTNAGPVLTGLAVNTTIDSLFPGAGLLSLRLAIAFANSHSSGISPITFDPTVFAGAQTITLTGSELELSSTTETETITGPSAGVTVSGGGLSRVFQVDPGVNASISGLTITGGDATFAYGGGLYNQGTTALTNCTVSGNSAAIGGGLRNSSGASLTVDDSNFAANVAQCFGGALGNAGHIDLFDSGFTGNSAVSAGGAVANSSGGSGSVSGCNVSGNHAGGFQGGGGGGGIFVFGGALTIANTLIDDNSTGTNGGGLLVFASAVLTNCTVNGNSASVRGGGVLNYGATTLTNCTVSGNSVTGNLFFSRGGGVYNYGTVALTDCTVSANSAARGGGLYDRGAGTTTLTDCTVSGNSAANGVGGGLYNRGTTTLINCTVSGNSASVRGGGVLNFGTTTLTNCTVSGNSAAGNFAFSRGGGGVFNYGTVALTNCTVSGNSSRLGRGGGIYNPYGTATLTNCTVTGNSAPIGGGLYSRFGTATLTNCTVSGNSASLGGGLDNANAIGTVTLGNTIVAKNTARTSGPDVLGTFASEGNNLVGKTDGSSGWVSSDLTGTIAQPLDPLLAPLGNYGGPTQTMALLPGSPAIDAGNNALIPAGVTTDQRGLPRIVNGVADIGAFESSGFTIMVTSGSGQSTCVLTAFPAPLVVKVTANDSSEPVAGGLVTFTPPPSGASATVSGSPAAISAAGTASVTASANGIVGSYTVLAAASGITTPASFSLTNYPLILVLDPSAAGALSLAGNASIKVAGVVYVDSSSPSALSASGNAQVKASAIDVHGKVQKSANASLSPTPITGAAVLAVVSLPSPSTLGMTNHGSFTLSRNSSATIQPGIYSQISVSGNAKLTMAGGVYIIEGGGFSVSGNAGVTGSGVMIFNAGSKYPTSSGGTYGGVTLSGNGACNLSPATSGAYAGIVFFQPADNTKALTVTANASGITGTIYAPAAQLSESGNGSLNASLIVDTLTISDNGVAGSLALVAPSDVVGSIVTTPNLSTPSALAASPSFASSSPGLVAWDLALADASTTGSTRWVELGGMNIQGRLLGLEPEV